MFGTGLAVARTRYRDLDISTKVEGASPHRLIGILFEELVKTLDAAQAAIRSNARPALLSRRARATSILLGLETSLDHGAGGDLSRHLAAVYREARRLIETGIAENDPDRIGQARELVSEVSDAWAQIG